MWMILLAALAAAPASSGERLSFPFTGFDLVRDVKGRILVDSVAPGRPAALANLPKGARLRRVLAPAPRDPALSGDLSGKTLGEIGGLFGRRPGEELILEIEVGGKAAKISLGTFPTAQPAGPEVALFMREMQQQFQLSGPSRASVVRSSRLDVEVSAPTAVLAGEVLEVRGDAGATKDWIAVRARVTYGCSAGAPQALNAVDGAKSHAVGLMPASAGGEAELDLYLWKVRDVRAACLRPPAPRTLPSIAATVQLTCQDGGRAEREVSAELALECAGRSSSAKPGASAALDADDEAQGRAAWLAANKSLDQYAPTLSEKVLLQGQAAELRLLDRTLLQQLRPQPLSMQWVVRGTDLGTQPFPPFYQGPTDPRMPLEDAKVSFTPRGPRVTVVIRADYPDGSSLLSRPVDLQVLTESEKKAQDAEWARKSQRISEALEKIKGWGEPCRDPEGFVAFVSGLPGVRGATIGEGGDISFSVEGVPSIVGCHGH